MVGVWGLSQALADSSGSQAGTPAPWRGRSSSKVSLHPAWIPTNWRCVEGEGSYQMPPLTVDYFIQNPVLTPG